MSSRLGRRFIIQSANGNNDLFAVARSVRHRAVTARTDLSREASCFRQIVPRDQFLPGYPAKLIGHQRDIRRPHAAGRFSAARAIAVDKSEKRRPHLKADLFAKTTASKHLIGHRALLIASIFEYPQTIVVITLLCCDTQAFVYFSIYQNRETPSGSLPTLESSRFLHLSRAIL
jgi:hypothetical protein